MCSLVLRNDTGDDEMDACAFGDIVAPKTLGCLGMDRDMSRRVLASLQQRICCLQEAELSREVRKFVRSHEAAEIKVDRTRKIHTLFGCVTVRIPRLRVSGKTRPFVKWPHGAHATPNSTICG